MNITKEINLNKKSVMDNLRHNEFSAMKMLDEKTAEIKELSERYAECNKYAVRLEKKLNKLKRKKDMYARELDKSEKIIQFIKDYALDCWVGIDMWDAMEKSLLEELKRGKK
jgi:trans-aconitate methyltransferase